MRNFAEFLTILAKFSLSISTIVLSRTASVIVRYDFIFMETVLTLLIFIHVPSKSILFYSFYLFVSFGHIVPKMTRQILSKKLALHFARFSPLVPEWSLVKTYMLQLTVVPLYLSLPFELMVKYHLPVTDLSVYLLRNTL